MDAQPRPNNSPNSCGGSLMVVAFRMGQCHGETKARLGQLQQTTDDILARIVAVQTAMQTAAPTALRSGPPKGALRSLVARTKDVVESFELLRKLWVISRAVWFGYIGTQLLRLLGWL